MKYKEIKLEDNKSILVDESAEIKSDEHYVAWEDNYKIPQWVIYVRGVGLNGKAPYKVIATINFSIDKDIPVVIFEDEVEKLALIEYPGGAYDEELARDCFITGYKAAQQKAEEDLIKAYDKGEQVRYSKVGEAVLKQRFIKSLNQEYIELEREYLSNDGNWKDVLLPSEWDAYTKNRIKTDRVGGQLMAYVKQ